jgi:N-acetylmuramoyl-L-alanine amidase
MNIRPRRTRTLVAALVVGIVAPLVAATPPPKTTYTSAMAREKALRQEWQQAADGVLPAATLRQARSIVQAYESVVRGYPTSGYCDNALWQAAALEGELFARAGQEVDRLKAVQLYEFLAREYPASPLARNAMAEARRLRSATAPVAPKALPEKPKPANETSKTEPKAKVAEPKAVAPKPVEPKPVEPKLADARPEAPPLPDAKSQPEPKAPEARATESAATIKDIKRVVLPEIVRVTIELDREVDFHQERVENPVRLLFDLAATKARPPLQDAAWSFDDDIVKGIRVGRHPNQVTRVVLDLDGVSRYSVVTLKNPYRILIDCERQAPPSQAAGAEDKEPVSATPAVPSPPETPAPKKHDTPKPEVEKPPAPKVTAPLPSDRTRVSMARQLGLGVSRVVIDPGHGGHDPGAEGERMSEAAIVLDIALRLERLLAKQGGVDVILTRRTDVYVPLEERTAMANREQADLFLSIHANASRNQKAHGVESYYLNFATNPEAEAVAARENAASARSMNNLTDIVKAIALNNKLDESKDFAGLVQQSLTKRLRPANKSLRDLGVKQAPFVVLIGAGMPSVLAEVSFVTHKREGELLGSDAYRQRIAEALSDAVVRYRKTLKSADYITQ